MTRRALLLASVLVLWTVVVYLGFAGLMYLGIDPQVNVATSDPELRHHGFPTICPTNSLIWVSWVVTYSAGVAWLTQRFFGGKRSQVLCLAIIIFAGTCLYLTMLHQTFLAVALPAKLWAVYRDFIREHLAVLDDIYGHWALPRLKYYVLVGQMVLTTLICLLAVARWRARPT